MMTIYNVADNILQVLGGLSVIAGITKLIYEGILYIKKKRYIKTLLLFKSRQCYISQSIYKKEATNGLHDFVTVNSMICFQKLQFMLNEVGYKVMPFTDSYVGENIIHIGGPSANINVNSIFVSKHYNFISVAPSSVIEITKKIIKDLSGFEFSEDDTSSFKIGDYELKLDEKTDYGIFIRIPNCKKDGVDYTTHIIFGGWANGTVNAVDFFIRNYKMIVEKYKKNRYCFVIPISRINNSTELLRFEDIKDLTDAFFGEV